MDRIDRTKVQDAKRESEDDRQPLTRDMGCTPIRDSREEKSCSGFDGKWTESVGGPADQPQRKKVRKLMNVSKLC